MFEQAVIINNETHHDAAVAYIYEDKIKTVLEYERVSRFKHSEFQNIDVDKTLIQFGIDEDMYLDVIDKTQKFKYNNHHEMHALGTFLSSGYNESCILVVDGSGDLNDSVTLFYGKCRDIKEIKKFDVQFSLGAMYAAASHIVYQTPNCEGKFMGLSCCSEPETTIPSPIQYDENGNVCCLYEYHGIDTLTKDISQYIFDNFPYLFNENNEILNIDIYKAKLAATVQFWFTEQIINLTKYLKSLYPDVENLCLAGGCFLNCETNGVLDRAKLFKNIYSLPAPADNGIIFGKIQQLLPDPVKIDTAYWGPEKDENLNELKDIFYIHKTEKGLETEIDCVKKVFEYNEKDIIDRLKQNKIILWFDGKSEFGPRALGHRSFLANPMSKEAFINLSINIKKRENYRPLAPITIDKLYTKIFEDDNPENLTQFMLKTVKIKKEWQTRLKAVTHINQTARPQRLIKDVNPVLYSLIENWYQESGVPCLINTSLNLKNQPLVETYNDLIALFVNNHDLLQNNACVVVNHCLCFDID